MGSLNLLPAYITIMHLSVGKKKKKKKGQLLLTVFSFNFNKNNNNKMFSVTNYHFLPPHLTFGAFGDVEVTSILSWLFT